MSFFPVFIISLPKSKRVNKIKSQLENLGIEYKVQDAVVGNNLNSKNIDDLVDVRGCDARLGYRIGKNLIGSGLSHIEVYKKAYAIESRWTLVLEEDAILLDFDEKVIAEVTSKCNDGAVIVQLFSRASRLIKNTRPIDLDGGRILFEFNRRLVGCGAPAYLINKEALHIALSSQKLVGAPDWPSWGQKIKFFGVYPWMIIESGDGSTVPDGSVPRFQYLKRRLFQLLGLHYLKYRSEYKNYKEYFLEEIKPYVLYLIWRLKGSKYFMNDPKGLQIL